MKNANGELTTGVYDVANQVNTINDTDGRHTYLFDRNGNQQVVESPSGQRTTRVWDYENMNDLVQFPDTSLVTMLFTGDNRRIQVRTDSGTQGYLWDGVTNAYLLETSEQPESTTVFTSEPDNFGPLISDHVDNKTIFFHFDGSHSTRDYSDESDNITGSLLNTAFGELVVRTGATQTPFEYIGLYQYFTDPILSDIYVRARSYSTQLARWLSSDPMFLIDDTNPYSYAARNPANIIDPSGLQATICHAVATIPLIFGIPCETLCDRYKGDPRVNNPRIHPRGGGIVCFWGQKCICLFDYPLKRGGRVIVGRCPDHDDCNRAHEMKHFNDVEPCDTKPGIHRPKFKPGTLALAIECKHRKDDLDCLSRALFKPGQSPDCKTQIENDLLGVIKWLEDNCEK